MQLSQLENPANLKKDDIITFMQLKIKVIVTHRIVEVIKNGDQVMYKTKGDNNEDADTNQYYPKMLLQNIQVLQFHMLGYLIDFAKSKNGAALLIILPGLLLTWLFWIYNF